MSFFFFKSLSDFNDFSHPLFTCLLSDIREEQLELMIEERD